MFESRHAHLTLKFMEQFYTKQVSKEVFDALLNKEYSTENVPTYAEVLDWLLNKDIEINVFQEKTEIGFP